MERVDAVVIGAGVMGSATAWALGERGVDTILLEQFEIGHARGSSHGPTRIFRLSYPQLDYVRLAQHALESWRRLEGAAGEQLLVTTGGLDAGRIAADCADALRSAGVEHEWLSPEAAEERWPFLSLGGSGDVLFQPDAGVSRADQTVAAQVRVARELGVDVRERTRVERLRLADDHVEVTTETTVVRAHTAVITAGSYAPELLPAAGLDLRLQPILQHVSYFAPSPPDMPTFIDWGSPQIGWYALGDGGVAPGLKVGEHAGGVAVDPRDGPFTVDPARQASHGAFVRRRFRGVDPEPVLSETCLYTMTPDEDFVLDRVGPLVIGGGFSGHGFKFAPLIGDILADLATGQQPRVPLERFATARPILTQPPL